VTTVRDSQRSATYAAEHLAEDGTILGEQPGFDALAAHCETIMDTPAWRRLFGDWRVQVNVRPMRSVQFSGRALGDVRVEFTDDATRLTVLHELAHSAHHHAGRSGAAHGPEFRGWEIALAEIGYGQDAAGILMSAFAELGLDWVRPGRSVEVTTPPPLAPTVTQRSGWAPPRPPSPSSTRPIAL
jgi:hypothetical protein